jgi:hypothetical protein
MAFAILDIGIVPGVLTRCSVAIVGRLLVIIFTNHEAGLHSQTGALDGVEAFLGVARHHGFRKAADELGVTTSAVSQAIRALEARVGVALFIRTTRSV